MLIWLVGYANLTGKYGIVATVHVPQFPSSMCQDANMGVTILPSIL